jgi:predicted Zn-dependent peptidase
MMKKVLTITITSLFFYFSQAQIKIDRTKRPEPGPAPIIKLKDPVIYKLPNGITVLIVEEHKLPRVSSSFYIDAGPIKEGAKAGVMELMGRMLNEGTKDMSKAAFDEAVDKIGADVSLSSSGGSATALTRYFGQAFDLMGKAIKSPALTQESFDKIKSQTLTGMKADEKNVKVVSARVINALAYGKQHPLGEFETEESVKNLTLADVKSAYQKYITPSRSYLTIIGDIKPEAAKLLAQRTFGNFKGSTLSLPSLPLVPNPAKPEIDVVDMPNAVQSEITVANLVDIKMNNPDYFAVLLANQILGGGSESRLFNNPREKHGFTYGAYSSIQAGRFQNLFTSSAAVRTAKTDSAIVEFITEISKLRNEKVSDEELTNSKALYNGRFALGLENPARTASFARNILINNLPKDFYKAYLQKINAVTKEDIQRVAQKYFNNNNTRVVVVGNLSQMKEGLSKLKYDVKMYDRFANPVSEASKAAGATNIKADDVFNSYIKAIGGAEALKKVNSIFATMAMEMQGMNLQVQMKNMLPNMESMTMSMGGNVVMKTSFNGTTGYQQQMGNKKELSPEEIKEKNLVSGLFEQLDYVNNPAFKTAVKGIEKVNGSDAYKVLITYPTGATKTEYYDVASKLLIRKEEAKTANNVTASTTIDYGDYRKAGAILYPYAQTLTISTNGQQQSLEMKASEVKINEGVTATDFQ